MDIGTTSLDIIDVLTAQHRQFASALDHWDDTGSGSGDRDILPVWQALTGLRRHLAAEEAWLYPEVRIDVVHGALWADRELAEHADAVKIIDELESLHAEHWLFRPTLSTLRCHLRGHFEEEEQLLFPMLAATLSRERRRELGRRVVHGESSD